MQRFRCADSRETNVTIRNFVLAFLFFVGVSGVVAGHVGDEPVADRLSSDFAQHTVTAAGPVSRGGAAGVVDASGKETNLATRVADFNDNRRVDEEFVVAAAGE